MRHAATIAAWAVLITAGSSGGAVIVTALPEPLVIEDMLFGRRDPVDLNSDGITDFTFGSAFNTVGLRTERANRVIYHIDPPPNVGGPIAPLSDGYAIGSIIGEADLAWRSSDLSDMFVDPDERSFAPIIICFGPCSGVFEGARASVGLEFELDDGIHYGYLDLQVFDGAPGARLFGWAWETEPGVPIIANRIPEPSASNLIAGSIAFLCTRRRKNKRGRTRCCARKSKEN
jgi:hypothetical protein